MSALRNLLSEYVDEVVAGSSPRTAELRTRLSQIRDRNAGYFILVVVMLVIVFLVAIALVVFSTEGRTGVIVVLSVFGISLIGMVRLMLALWREKLAIELLIELSELDDNILKKVVAKLLRQLK